ncbi:unnamed protein product, partial [Adineta ricciae]
STKTETTTEEKKEEAPSASNAPPAVEVVKEETKTETTIEGKDKSVSEDTSKSGDAKTEEVSQATSSASATQETPKTGETTSVTSTETKTESEPALASSAPDAKDAKSAAENTTITDDSKKEDESKLQAAPASEKDDNKPKDVDFPIVKDSAKNLTDFQRKKAEYFFNVNLDIENKKYVTWDDVEFYLLFHVTAAGKEGADGGELEKRLSRAARAFWEHIHDQVPSSDGKRDKVTLEQFLDTWASLIDYFFKNGKLPSLVQDLVDLGFELYSKKDGDGTSSSIPASSFDQLFQKMNLEPRHALVAYTFLTENGTKPLDADKVNSIVRAVITSSDDVHNSRFLLPGFANTITTKPTEKDAKQETPAADKDTADKEAPKPSQPEQPSEPKEAPKPSSEPNAASTNQQKQQQQAGTPQTPSGSAKTQQTPTSPQQPGKPPSPGAPGGTVRPPQSPTRPQQPQQPGRPSQPNGVQSYQQQQQQLQPGARLTPQQQKDFIKLQDDNIRRLLSYYHLDDREVVEVDDGPAHRFLLVHPERPLPPYVQQNKQLLQQLQGGPTILSPPALPSGQQTRPAPTPSQPAPGRETPSDDGKPKVTLEERLASGEAQKGPTIPLRNLQQQGTEAPTAIRQVYPPVSGSQQQQQKTQAGGYGQQTQVEQPKQEEQLKEEEPLKQEGPSKSEEQKKPEEQTKSDESSETKVSSSSSGQTDEKKEITKEDEEKIVESVLKQMTPIVEQLVAAEVRRTLLAKEGGQDDDNDFVPFPFMFGGGPMPPPGANFGGVSGGAAFIPPELLMSMMSDLARGGVAGDMPDFSANAPPRGPGGAPVGVGGFMMFADDSQMMGGQPPRP